MPANRNGGPVKCINWFGGGCQLLDSLARGHVGNRGLAESALLAGELYGNAVKLYEVWSAVFGNQGKFSSHFTTLATAVVQMRQKRLLILSRYVVRQRIPRQFRSIPAQQCGTGQVNFLDVALFIQGDVAQRGEIIEINIAVTVGF